MCWLLSQAGQFDFDALAFSELEEAVCLKPVLACWLLVLTHRGAAGKKIMFDQKSQFMAVSQSLHD